MDADPTWSPDGRQIAFESDRAGTGGIFVMNADGSGQRRLTQNGGDPAWSPEGQWIAFVRSDDVYVMHADGTNLRRLSGGELPGWLPARR